MNIYLIEQTPMSVRHRMFGIFVHRYEELRMKNAWTPPMAMLNKYASSLVNPKLTNIIGLNCELNCQASRPEFDPRETG